MESNIGHIVRYKGDFHVVLEESDITFKLIAPHHGNRKLQVKRINCTDTGLAMSRVVYKDKPVLVSRKGTIISLVSNRLLKSTTPDGQAMLAIAFQ